MWYFWVDVKIRENFRENACKWKSLCYNGGNGCSSKWARDSRGRWSKGFGVKFVEGLSVTCYTTVGWCLQGFSHTLYGFVEFLGLAGRLFFHVLMDGEGGFGMLGCRAITEEIRFDLKWSVLWNVKSASFKKRW